MGYYDERSLLAGTTAPQVNVNDFTRAGSLVTQALKSQRERENEDARLAREAEKFQWEKNRFDRENLLNQRQDAEYNREIGLRDTRKALANEFAANKFANKFGNKDTEAFQQDIVDYVNKGGVVTDDLASRWQNRIEQAVPFQEDAKGALKAELLKRGEDPLKADAYAESMTTGMVSRAGRQAILDANRKDQQDYYKQVAEANRDIAKMGVDVYKEQAGNKTEMDKARMNLFGAGGGSGSGGGIGGTTYNKLDVGDYNLSVLPQWTKVGDEAKLQEVIRGFQAAGVPAGLVNKAIENSIDKGLDNTINYDLLEKNMMNAKNMYGGTGTTSNVDVPNLDRAAYMPQYVPKQVVGYDPNKWREESKVLFPEMYPKVAEESKSVSGSTVVSKMPESLVKAEGVRNEPYKDTKGNVTVGVGYAFNKDIDEIKRDFKEAGIPEEKIAGLKAMDGTKLTNAETSRLADVSYDRYGVKKLDKIGVDVNALNPTLAEIGVSQAYRGDIVKNGSGYRGKLYEYLKNDDLNGMVKYVNGSKEVPKEVKTRLDLVINREGPISKEQAMYEGIIPRSAATFTEPVNVSGSAKSVDAFNALTPTVVDKTKERLIEDFSKNGSGPIDYARYVKNVMKDGNVSRGEATDIVNKYINSQQTPEDTAGRVGGIGNMPVTKSPKQLFNGIDTHDRLAELNRVLGDNPAPTPENVALIDERQALLNSMVSPSQKVRDIRNDLVNRYLNFTGIGSGIPTK